DPLRDQPLPDRAADELGALLVPRTRVTGELPLQGRLGGRRRRDRPPGSIVDYLHIDMPQAAKDREPRPFGRAGDPRPLSEPDALAAILLRLDSHNFYAPVFPAFFFNTSPVYRTPFCLYGSGLRNPRMFAATCPTCWRSIPVTVMCVCFSTAMSIPCGM